MTGFFIALGIVLLIVGVGAFFGAPYVPSQRRFVKKAFETLYQLDDSDVLIDIGAGDGVILREASEHGARAVGYEINPLLYLLARWLCRAYPEVSLRFANFWTSDLPLEATVVYAFSVNRDAGRLMRKIQAQADRAQRRIALVCLGSPFQNRVPDASLDAYTLYYFTPSFTPEDDRV